MTVAAGPGPGSDRQPAVTEVEWQQQVVDLAHVLQWTVAHFRPARVGDGWRTPVAADGAGFVDLVLARDRVLFVELKSDTGRVTQPQREWLIRLRAAGAEVHVWRPGDFDEARATLTRRRRYGGRVGRVPAPARSPRSPPPPLRTRGRVLRRARPGLVVGHRTGRPMTCDVCQRPITDDEACYPHDRACPRDPWCTCDTVTCPSCCWDCDTIEAPA